MGSENVKQWAVRGGVLSAAFGLLASGIAIAQRDYQGAVGKHLTARDFASDDLHPVAGDAQTPLETAESLSASAAAFSDSHTNADRPSDANPSALPSATEPVPNETHEISTVGYESPPTQADEGVGQARAPTEPSASTADGPTGFQLPPPIPVGDSAPIGGGSAGVTQTQVAAELTPSPASLSLPSMPRGSAASPSLDRPLAPSTNPPPFAAAVPAVPVKGEIGSAEETAVPSDTGRSADSKSTTARLGPPQYPPPGDARGVEDDPAPAPISSAAAAHSPTSGPMGGLNPPPTDGGFTTNPLRSPMAVAAGTAAVAAGATDLEPAAIPSLTMPTGAASAETARSAPSNTSAGIGASEGGFPQPPLTFPDLPASAQTAPEASRGATAAADSTLQREPPAFPPTTGATVAPPAYGSTLASPPASSRNATPYSPAGGRLGAIDTAGDRSLDGPQAPQVQIQKQAPDEVRLGSPATFTIAVQNTGNVMAYEVTVADRVPQGMRLIESQPVAQQIDGELQWDLGEMEPGAQRTITMQLQPEQEGELGSVARVRFSAAAGVRVQATQAVLKVTQRAPPQVLTGQQVEIEIELSNQGSGQADNIVLHADLSEGLEHPTGRSLDNLIQQLRPGEQRKLMLRLRATQPGLATCKLQLEMAGAQVIEDVASVDVIAPQLAVALNGPAKRYLERQATYELTVTNTGTAPATNIDIVAYLARGMTFVSTEHKGQYDPNQHAVFWSLAELPPGSPGKVPLTVLPIESGDQTVRVQARGDLNTNAQTEKLVSVESLAELNFQISDEHDPIEEGSETTYEIRITNTGSREDSGVQLNVLLPRGLSLISAEPAAGPGGSGEIQFAPIERLGPKEERIYRIKVQGTAAGQHVIRASLRSDSLEVPVAREESTRVYGDQ